MMHSYPLVVSDTICECEFGCHLTNSSESEELTGSFEEIDGPQNWDLITNWKVACRYFQYDNLGVESTNSRIPDGGLFAWFEVFMPRKNDCLDSYKHTPTGSG